MKILLYEIYGSDRRYHLELTYSVLSAAQFLQDDPADIRIVLLADEKNIRSDLPVENIVITPESLHEWHMQGTYTHAIQAYALGYAIEKFDVPTVLIDGDTIYREHPKRLFERISPGRILMNAREGELASLTGEWPKYQQIIDLSEGQLCGLPISSKTVMFNSGVMGMHPHDAHLISRVKEMLFCIREFSDVFTAIQLATSMVFERNANLETCDDLIEHYWGGPREYYHYQINRMYPEVLKGGGISRFCSTLVPLNGIPKGNPLHRVAARAKGLIRNAPHSYRHAYMAYLSALALRTSDPEMANVWAARAVNVLAWAMTQRLESTEKDFKMFSAQRLGEHSWLAPGIRQKWLDYWNRTIGPSSG